MPGNMRRLAPARDVLSPYQRPAREDLRSWAARLGERLTPGTDARTAAGALNNVALVYAHLGLGDLAEWACQSQLTWLAAQASARPELLALAFQPYINLGRLEALSGEGGRARERFRSCLAFQDHDSVTLGPCRVESHQWDRIVAAQPDLPRTLSSTYLIDSIKTWFIEGDYAGGQRFLRNLQEERLELHPVAAHESRLICQVELGEHEQAVRDAAAWDHSDSFMAAVTTLHVLPSLVVLHAGEVARSRASVVTDLATGNRWDWVPTTARLRFLERLVDTLTTLNLTDERARALLASRQLAEDCGDQVSLVRCLALLDQVTSGREREAVRRRRAELVGVCDYAVVRRTEDQWAGRPLDLTPYTRLAERVEAIIGADRAPV